MTEPKTAQQAIKRLSNTMLQVLVESDAMDYYCATETDMIPVSFTALLDEHMHRLEIRAGGARMGC